MSGPETAAIALGTAVAKTACQMWLGDDRLLPAAGVNAIDIAAQRLTSAREQRRFRRLWDQAAELVADRVEPLLAHEFRAVPEHERLAAVDAAQATFDAAALTEADLFAQDLDAGFLDRHLRRQDPDRVRVAGLSMDAAPLYDRLLREGCAYAIELARTLPGTGITALTEVLRRERQLLDDMRTVLERLPARRGPHDFDRDYRQLVAGVLHRLGVEPPDGGPVDLGFVPDLSRLRELFVLDMTDLSPLAGCDLDVLWQFGWATTKRDPLSLAPLVDVRGLTVLSVQQRVADLAPLRALEQVENLHLAELGTSQALRELTPLRRLSSLDLGGMPDLRDARDLSFLESPEFLGFTDCPTLVDLGHLSRWSTTLRSVRLEGCPAADLTTLGELDALHGLNLVRSGSVDLAPIASLPQLYLLALGGSPLPDLRPMKTAPALARLHVIGATELDVSPLAGREGLSVGVDRHTAVHGADRLGPGSRVVRY